MKRQEERKYEKDLAGDGGGLGRGGLKTLEVMRAMRTYSVIATRAFVMGAVIYDYHGELVTAEEGRKILKVQQMKWDTFTFHIWQPAVVHQRTDTSMSMPPNHGDNGAKMNHSKNNLNVNPNTAK
ncbi:hypothetical protein Q5P01_017867 [Channa striata]|uniref:Uncharacterized protein n=1 Tax=Channa striata TaxID=64152 RepID=A0AA88M3N0_CHASR|nr:hypothetical protein Q5P01_017867 [Channa striata]